MQRPIFRTRRFCCSIGSSARAYKIGLVLGRKGAKSLQLGWGPPGWGREVGGPVRGLLAHEVEGGVQREAVGVGGEPRVGGRELLMGAGPLQPTNYSIKPFAFAGQKKLGGNQMVL